MQTAQTITTYITAVVRISQYGIFLNGKTVFKGKHKLDDFLTEAYNWLNPDYPKFYKMDRLCKLGLVASEVLVSKQSIRECPSTALAIILSNANASHDTDLRYHDAARLVPSPALFVYTLPNIMAGEICIRNNIKGPNAVFITPEFDAELMYRYTEGTLADQRINASITGWIDVLHEHHEVLLYLVEKEERGIGLIHTPAALNRIYRNNLWNN